MRPFAAPQRSRGWTRGADLAYTAAPDPSRPGRAMTFSSRRAVLAALAAAACPAGSAMAQDGRPAPFGFAEVARRARAIAAAPYEVPPALPDALARLDPARLAAIRFRPERALLGSEGGPFRMQLFHAGPGRPRPATVNVVRDGIPIPIPYQPGLFDFGGPELERLPVNLGFAGLRLHGPLNDPRVLDEVAAFLGPGEMRVLGRGDRYGLAARLLASDASAEAEAPATREFWVELPKAGAEDVVVHLLLDGPDAAAACRVRLRPGASTEAEVRAAIYPRRPLAGFSLAPLLSRYAAGEADPPPAGEYRPEIHDSDGLLLRTGAGEWLWRPLRRYADRHVSAFLDRAPRGFGLLQRDRRFESYQDLEAAFERRPGYWIEPDGDWGEGQVLLAEAPPGRASAGGRNVLACWQPRAPVPPGGELAFAFRLRTVGAPEGLHPGGRCVNTFEAGEGAARRFLVDFAGGDLGYHLADPSGVEVVASASAGNVAGRVVPNPAVGGFRAILEARLDPGAGAELRAYLRAGGRTLTETWTLPWTAR